MTKKLLKTISGKTWIVINRINRFHIVENANEKYLVTVSTDGSSNNTGIKEFPLTDKGWNDAVDFIDEIGKCI